jgi:hypothetical protein
MNKHPRNPGHNVVHIPVKAVENRVAPHDFTGNAAAPATAGSPDDPRVKEAVRLMQAFLAVEDATARGAIITLAESLVSHDWVRNAQRR